jgi:LytS/YehU family sensor histidine kinase
VPLSREMQIVRAYLEVEQLRLGDRLRVELHVDDVALDVPVPVLSVQPLVENAIKHGVAPSPEPGYVRVRVAQQPNELRISVENSGTNGPGGTSGTGVGLRNVRRRLEICYGSGANLDLVIDDQKATAEISIPITAVAAHSESLRK